MSRLPILIIIMALWAPVVSAEEVSPPVSPTEQQLLLKDAVKPDKPLFDSLQAAPVMTGITAADLDRKRFERLKEMQKQINSQRASMLDFEGYVKWMGGTLSSYSKYVEAGSLAAGFARLLPIPYAGQAGQFSRFVAHFALSLSQTSAAVKQYLGSSQQFVQRVDAMGNDWNGKDSELAFLTFYADQQLSSDMKDLSVKLAGISDLSTSALSFLISIQQYLGSTDEYWQKTKNLMVRKENEKVDKGLLAGSIDGLKVKTDDFNKKLLMYKDSVAKTVPMIASLLTYEELRQDLVARQ